MQEDNQDTISSYGSTQAGSSKRCVKKDAMLIVWNAT